MAKQMKVIDPDNPPLTDEQLAAMRPASEVLPPELFARLTKRKPGQRGPGKKGPAMETVSVKVPPDVISAFKANNGDEWRTAMRETLVRAASRLRPGATAAKKRSA
jgi:uncharacterized protein (DUF4415 family)